MVVFFLLFFVCFFVFFFFLRLRNSAPAHDLCPCKSACDSGSCVIIMCNHCVCVSAIWPCFPSVLVHSRRRHYSKRGGLSKVGLEINCLDELRPSNNRQFVCLKLLSNLGASPTQRRHATSHCGAKESRQIGRFLVHCICLHLTGHNTISNGLKVISFF